MEGEEGGKGRRWGGEGERRREGRGSGKAGEEETGKVNVCMGGVGEVLDHLLWDLVCRIFHRDSQRNTQILCI